jgi:hypothetical protein
MRKLIFAITFFVTAYDCVLAKDYVVMEGGKELVDLNPSICQSFTVPADFLKLCRFLMFANSMSYHDYATNIDNHKSMEKSLTPLLIEKCEDARDRVKEAFSGRNVVATRINGQDYIICTGIGVLYTSDEKKRLESVLAAKVLDILDIAYIGVEEEDKVDILRDNLILHGLLLRLKWILENGENKPSRYGIGQGTIEEIRARISKIVNTSLIEGKGEISVEEIDKLIATLSEKTKECLNKIGDLMEELVKSDRLDSNDITTMASAWLTTHYRAGIGERLKDIVIKMTNLGSNSALGGFVKPYGSKDEGDRRPPDETTRHISDLLHSEQLYISWYGKKFKDGKEREVYFFTQRDMCQSCDDRIADWMGLEGVNHPKSLLVLSAQMCNRQLEASADYTLHLVGKGSKKYGWSPKDVQHPGRLGEVKSANITRIRIPALTIRFGAEYEPPFGNSGRFKTTENWWSTDPGQEQVVFDENFDGKMREWELGELFPRRAAVVRNTCKRLKPRFAAFAIEPVSMYGKAPLADVVENLQSAQRFLASPAESSDGEGQTMRANSQNDFCRYHVLSYALKLLDVYSDVLLRSEE